MHRIKNNKIEMLGGAHDFHYLEIFSPGYLLGDSNTIIGNVLL